MGISFFSRIFHNLDLLSPRYAFDLSRLLYSKDGSCRGKQDLSEKEIEVLELLIGQHKIRSKHCIEYWTQHNIKVIPKKDIRKFIADRYADCNLDTAEFLSRNRDLFYTQGYQGVNYATQVDQMVSELVLDNSYIDKIRSRLSSRDVSN